eukprot:m.1020622 g.1020622  ORF g.1020622 m.1020622 type:complete len:202 (-) comp24087_c0_seq104:2855-3460(-)
MAADPLMSKYTLKRTAAFNLNAGDQTYVFDLVSSECSPEIIAASASNHVIKIYDRNTLTLKSQLKKEHRCRITGIQFAHTNPNLLLSCSDDDGKICMWDIRTGDVVQRYSVGNGGQIAPSCCDINCSDQVICVGSNLVNNVDDKDAIVALWYCVDERYLHRSNTYCSIVREAEQSLSCCCQITQGRPRDRAVSSHHRSPQR